MYLSIFTGVFGSGKDTQARLLEEAGIVKAYSVGGILRDVAKTDKDIQKYLTSGTLVPAARLKEVLLLFFKGITDRENIDHIVLTGFPRVLEQVDILLNLLNQRNWRFFRAFNFRLDDEVLADRILYRRICPKCGAIYNLRTRPPLKDGICDHDGTPLQKRKDDNLQVLCQRYEVYLTQTVPVIKFFEKNECLVDIDASRSVQDIYEELVQYFKNLSPCRL